MKIIISGGASGLGGAITKKMAEEGHEILITFYNSKEKAEELQASLNAGIAQVDFCNEESLESFFVQMEEFQPDVIINNAIVDLDKQYFHKTVQESFVDSFSSNVLPILKMTQHAIKIFRKKKFGKIITILSSAVVNRPPIGWSLYVANKNYLLSMSKSWAIENIKYNISSNCISPAFMETPLNEDTDERIVQNMIQSHPLKKLLTIEEVAESVHYLVDATQHVNGTNILINTGENVI